MSFGGYNVFATTPTDSVATISYTCTKKEKSVRITLDRGASATFNRVMMKGAELLAYNLYLEPTRTSVWGDGSSGTVTYTSTRPSNQRVDLPVYGRIPSLQDVS